VRDVVDPAQQEQLLKEQQAGAGDDVTPAAGEDGTAEGGAASPQDNKEG
jgi:hypothetical protein